MNEYVEAITQFILIIGFSVASFRLGRLASKGSGRYRWFRRLAAAVTLGWALFYIVAVIDFHYPDFVSVGFQQNFARTLQYFNLTVFIMWPVLADPTRERLVSDCTDQMDKLRKILS